MTLKQGPHTDCCSCVTLNQRILGGFKVLTPPENGAGEFSVRKKCQHFQEKLGSRVVQVGKFHVHVFSATPNKKSKIIGNRHTNCVMRKRASYAPRPPLPSSWFLSPTGPRLWTFTWSKPASGPEFPAPLNPMHPFSLYAPPHFPRNQPVLATGLSRVQGHTIQGHTLDTPMRTLNI